MAVIIVSSRLPVRVRHVSEGFTFTERCGGVATGLRAVQERSGGVWVGWPGPTDSFTAAQRLELEAELARRQCVPLFLPRAEARGFYQKYANGVLWPLLHYLPQHVSQHGEQCWDAYERANRRMADLVAQRCGADDEVWVQDYEFMLVPGMLRALRPSTRIGFFLHVPFPAWEVFRTLPHRRQLLEGLLGADLVGFQTADYAAHFTESVTCGLGRPATEQGGVVWAGRTVMTGVFPMGIDVARFEGPSDTSPFDLRAGSGTTADGHTMVAIDRLDCTKGIPAGCWPSSACCRITPS